MSHHGWLLVIRALKHGGYGWRISFKLTHYHVGATFFAGATVTAHENGHPTTSNPFPIVLVNTAGHWQITSDTAMGFIMNVWYHYGHRAVGGI